MTVPQCNGTTKDDSDPITITVSPVINPSVVISASSTVVCKNSIVTFTANANDAGTNENYTWKVNGNSVGSNSKTYSSSSLNNGDIVTCELSVAPSVKCAVNTKVVSNSIAIKVTAPPKVLVQIIASDNDFCGTKPVVFKASIQNAGAGSIYQWQLNGNKVSSDNESYININPVDGDEIKLIVTYTDPNCSLVINDTSNIIKMSVKLPPVISIAPSDTTVALGSSVQLNSKVTGSIASISWSPANNVTSQTLSPVTTPLQAPVKYKLDVVATNGCSASKEAVIKVITEFNMPNSFTPNGDGKNDVFRIPPGVTMQLKEFSIFDRWGKKIFTTSDINKGWDGNYNNIPLGTGTYIYFISGTGHQGQGINAKGTLLVIR
jgi:gliding motility-associated-like protein